MLFAEMRCLSVRVGGEALRFPVPSAESRLGSDASNEIVVLAPGVSRFHARVVPDLIAPRLFDLGSKNGLVVDGRRHREVILLPGVRVQAGAAVISLDDFSTSEVELSIEPDVPWGSAPDPKSEARGATETVGGAGSAAEALALLRDLDRIQEDGRPRPELEGLLDRLCATLGVESAALLRRAPRGVETVAVAGRALAPQVSAWLAAAPFVGPEALTRDVGPHRVVGRISADGARAAVVVSSASPLPGSAWRSEILDLVLDALANEAPVIPSRRPEPGERALVTPEGMVFGSSAPMRELRDRLVKFARSKADVLVLGETGTGKELVARALHLSGPTSRGPFVALNCAALPAELLEAELFGVRPRVATGVDGRPGRIREAEGGMLVLDEIGELPAPLQAKLLRFLQEREVQPVGASGTERVNVRVVSVSNRDLGREVEAGRCRADPFHRVRCLECRVPPLRERKEDIPHLVHSFAAKAAEAERKRVRGVSRGAMRALLSYDWPGNVRELQVEVRRAVVLCPDGGFLSRETLADAPWAARAASAPSCPAAAALTASAEVELDLRKGVQRLEVSMIRAALERAEGNRTKAAKLLGLTRAGLRLKLRRLLGGS